MVWIDFLSAFALLLVFEGLMPFASPERWKRLLLHVIAQDSRTLRAMGFISMMAGVLILTVVHQFFE